MKFSELPPHILEKLKYWKTTIEATKDFTGTSPPSVFVGSYEYPKVFVGVLSPPVQQPSTAILDSPEQWFKNKTTIEQILSLRGELIYSRFKSDVNSSKGKLIDVVQEVAMAKKSTDVEVNLKKNPRFVFNYNTHTTPVGSPATLLAARITENLKVEHKVEYMISDVDLLAENAVVALYKSGIPISRIEKIFSSGLLGVQMQRKFVPTRWGITAVDDIVGKYLREKVKEYPESDEIMVFHSEYIGNHYEVLLLPGAYQFELVEFWGKIFGMPNFSADYEPFQGRKTYANHTHGAFYAGRLAVMEYLEKIRRQAVVLIVREVRSEYSIPVGIWQLRESVRDAMNNTCETFSSVQDAVKKIAERIYVKDKWVPHSKIMTDRREQKKITQFSNSQITKK
jgi:DNA repair protein NreA